MINFAQDILNKLDYDEGIPSESYNKVQSQLFALVKEAGWTKTRMVYAFGTLQNNSEKIGSDFFSNNPETRSAGCNCNWGWCPGSSKCKANGCSDTSSGCGFLGSSDCDKQCGGSADEDDPTDHMPPSDEIEIG